MWQISLAHWWEFVLRAAIVYGFLLVILRLTGKRQVGQLAPFDLVLLLVLSNAVQNSMNGGDNSITGGMILSATLVGLNSCVGWLSMSRESVVSRDVLFSAMRVPACTQAKCARVERFGGRYCASRSCRASSASVIP